MQVSLLQPEISRGNIENNLKVIQKLVDRSKGDLLVLPEYALTGSLTLDSNADVREWARRSAQAITQLRVPDGKYLLINSLVEFGNKLYNCCKLLPTEEYYCKMFPDQTELNAGILPGVEPKVFRVFGKRFIVVICSDLRNVNEIHTDNLDFLLFIYHFTETNFSRVIEEVKQLTRARRLSVFASSLVSDKNYGFSSFINNNMIISLSNKEDILEIDIE